MLFGHQNDDKQSAAPLVNDVSAPASNPLAVDPDTGVSLPVAPEELEHDGSSDAPVLDQPHADPAPVSQTYSPSNDTRADEDAVRSLVSDDDSASPTPQDDMLTPSDSDDLLLLKQQALQQLSPLVSHLDQSPEEKFRTTMMMIQSSDNQALIKDAYEAAQQISDEKAKAQALLDIVNEINYFTQHQDQ